MAAGIRRRFLVRVFRRVWKFVALFIGINLVAAVGFYFLQGAPITLPNAFYWAIVTISTTGYGDLVPVGPAARWFTAGLLYTQIFLLGYLFSVITGIVTTEAQNRALGTLGTSMKDHVVVLGYSPVGRAAVRELLLEDQTVAVVAEHAEDVANIRSLGPESRLYATYGSPSDTHILERANVATAHSVIICTHDDTTNLIASLNVRAMAPRVRIVVSVSAPELKETLRAAGVTYVASPSDLSGRLCSSAAFRPDVASAIEELTTETSGADIHEYVLAKELPISTQTFAEATRTVQNETGCITIGYARAVDDDYTTTINPPGTFRLRPGDALLMLGSLDNLQKCRKLFGIDQGR
ncbi:MAG: NAD-binding protein [Thermoplasmata archaeon]|nr:NAD-binding protein [Thermoplasmata archaeon]